MRQLWYFNPVITCGIFLSHTVLFAQEAEFSRPLKRSTGIPNSFMKVVDDMNQPGVMLTGSGQLAVPTIDAYVKPRLCICIIQCHR